MVDRSAPEQLGGVATAEQGIVVLDGPNGVAVTMTPDSAEATGESLVAAAREARRQSADPA
jgi:hypothetical protein